MSFSIMLDMETLSTQPDATILTIGAIKFDPYTVGSFGDALYFRVDVDEQLAMGRHVSESTLAWWGNQAADVRDEALGDTDRISLDELYIQLNRFVAGSGDIWAQGPVFDIVILENLYKQKGWPVPWQYWQVSDSRTVFKMHGDPRVKGKVGLHNALEDSKSQAGAIQQIYTNLGLVKRTYEGT